MSAALAIGQRVLVSARVLWGAPIAVKFRGVLQALLAALLLAALISWNPADPSLNAASGAEPTNWLGLNGALFADLFMQSLGLAAWPATLLLVAFGLAAAIGDVIQQRLKPTPVRALSATGGVLALSAALSALAAPAAWPLAAGLGGLWGDAIVGLVRMGCDALRLPGAPVIAGLMFLPLGLWGIGYAVGLRFADLGDGLAWARGVRA
ncbi:MAG: DNA translocase FtsK 4TM domain-containing protein, partial [Alphaproteobacteria bacterium]|nr:DNA translocase FtsK 4TM domain-containing protein [Alphaproteobacteria bacterium]